MVSIFSRMRDPNFLKKRVLTQKMADAQFMKDLIAFARERGFIWGPAPEIYGGLAGFYDYGPLGKLLKNNVEATIRSVFNKHDFWEVECPTVLQAKVWEASGHLGNFTDWVVKDEKGASHRADHVVKEFFAKKKTLSEAEVERLTAVIDPEKIAELITTYHVTAPDGTPLVPDVKRHNLMMKTTLGLDIEAYNRPETATTTYLPFPRYFDFFRKKLPFGVFQIGKAYRNEISPRQFVLRMREFTQAEGQLFIFKDQKNSFEPYMKIKDEVLPFWATQLQAAGDEPGNISVAEARKKGYLKNDAYAFPPAVTYDLFRSVGIPAEKIRLRQHADDEKAFYADDAWDVEVELKSFGWTEMCGVHDRTDYDLGRHQKFSGSRLTVSDETHKDELAHVLEIAFGTDRMTFVLLDLLYNPQEIAAGKTTLHVPVHIAPIKAAVYPLVKKDGMPEIAQAIYDGLVQEFVCVYDQSGTIGRRYLRAAEQGIPFCITVDGQTITDGTVTLRERDTAKQVRVHKDDLAHTLHLLLTRKKAFDELT